MADPIAFLGLAIESAIGWPSRLHAAAGHPVGLFAKLIAANDRQFNRVEWSDRRRRLAGLGAMGLLIGLTLFITMTIETVIRRWAGDWAWVPIAILSWPAIAARSLDDHVRPVWKALQTGDLGAARQSVGMIVGRDTGSLDERGVTRAAIESLAESFSDGVVAPLFWLAVFGFPGAWVLKAINTADSMIGHREEPYRAYGWAAARMDDLAMLVPARLSALLLCIAGGGGWRTVLRDHASHASPNAGWPEAAMAGALGVRLAGPIAYEGIVNAKPWIGKDLRDCDPADLRRALHIYRAACGLLAAVALGVAITWPV